MLPIVVKIVSYDKENHKCKIKHSGDCVSDFDPFVGCAIRMSDEDYEAGKGHDLVGNSYCVTFYTVYPTELVPHEGGLKQLN